jgi:membrane-bound inhibitor of C-type lysozyme
VRPYLFGLIAVLASLISACETTDGGKRIPARFECDDGAKLNLIFDHTQDAAVVRLPKGQHAVLPSQHPAAGMFYAGGGYELRGSGDTVTYAAPDRPQTRCTQTR